MTDEPWIKPRKTYDQRRLDLGLTAERVFVRIYELEQIMRGEYEEDGK